MLSYGLYIATTILALLYLAKDWAAHKKSWRRLTVLILIILIGIGGVINTHYTNQKNNEQREDDRRQIAGLQKALETANKIQEDNTKHFVEGFTKLSQKIADLQTQVSTADLREEAEQLRTELKATQKALVTPKAVLAFTFERPKPDAPLLRTITLPVKNDVVHVEFTLRNETDVPALNGEVTLIICKRCEFASEPPLFKKLLGQPDTERNYQFNKILPMAELSTLTADIKVPPDTNAIEIRINYRCANCIVPEPKANSGIVFLSR
jgi:hypothetical protein